VILTGTEIGRECGNGRITIEPFRPDQVNPNSYNFRLGRQLSVYTGDVLDPRRPNPHTEIEMPDEGFVLEPRQLYLAHTEEVLGSTHYVPTFAARSSVARLGLFINLSASLGDIGFIGQWTLQLYSVNRIRVYPGMCIGQMMWWTPQGTVQLYDGKYQGSAGPRASDVHLDYSRQRLPGLDAPVSPADTGAKFAVLAALREDFDIPGGFSIPVRDFAEALGGARVKRLEDAFADIRGTCGAFVEDALQDIAALAGTSVVGPELRELIGVRLAETVTSGADLFAVRSSAIGEDGERSSLAGVHNTTLGASDLDEVVKAVEACWHSYYAPSSVLARVRIGDFAAEPRMSVFVQRMVRPRLAGVAFSRSASVVETEYIEGAGESLMAGVAVPKRATVCVVGDAEPTDLHQRVARMTLRARAILGGEVDIEWALDGADMLWLLQCRPVTAPLAGNCHDNGPVLRFTPLYDPPVETGQGVYLGTVAEIVASYRRKRSVAYQIARRAGSKVIRGWIVNVNGLGLRSATTAAALDEELRGSDAGSVVLDLGDGLRQQIVPRSQLRPRLERLLCAEASDSSLVHALVVRDFVSGELGAVSQTVNGELFLEASRDGLLAINRGHASTGRVPDLGDVGFTAAQRDIIRRVTAELDELYGSVTAEWVLDKGQLYFVDYSVMGATYAAPDANRTIISPGESTGPIFTLDIADTELTRLSLGAAVSVSTGGADGDFQWARNLVQQVAELSSKPVVVARRPYAALAVLIDHVAGFVFEDGSVLCHLGILLREAGLPAVIHAHPPVRGAAHITSGGVTFRSDTDSGDIE
jgi:deoxycytidine triphosphate deaminase